MHYTSAYQHSCLFAERAGHVSRLDGLHGSAVRSLAAAKFHSAALTEAGDLYTWGYGRGGRLGTHALR